jgi:hypothetical protein
MGGKSLLRSKLFEIQKTVKSSADFQNKPKDLGVRSFQRTCEIQIEKVR